MTEILFTSSVLILVMALTRLVLRKRVSQRLIYGLWLLVALRLLIPVQFGQSKYSVTTVAQPAANQVQQAVSRPISGPSREEVYDQLVQDYLAQAPVVPETPTLPEVTAPTVPPQVQTQLRQEAAAQITAPSLGEILTGIWIAGMVAMGMWFLTANLLFLRKIWRDSTVIARSEATWQSPETTENLGKLPRQCAHWLAMTGKLRLRICPNLDTPCLVGIFRPTVCLTPACLEDEDALRHVLAHETSHLRHGDHIWSLVRCLCLCIYWFNPLVWLAAILSKRDQELACDEAALKKLGEEERIPYGKTLLTIVSHSVTPGKFLRTATSMSETKKQLKERIEFIVKQPKNLWFAAISLILIAALTTGIVFTGCKIDENNTPSATEPSQSIDPSQPPKEVTLEICAPKSFWASSDSWLNRQLAAFQSLHPEYIVTWKLTDTDDAYSILSSDDPHLSADVFFFNNDLIGQLKEVDAIQPLSGVYVDQVNADNSQAVIDSVTYDYKGIYGFPIGNTDGLMLVYNKSVYSPEDVLSWDTLLEKGRVWFPVYGYYSTSFFMTTGCSFFGPHGNDRGATLDIGGVPGRLAKLKIAQLVNHPNFVRSLDIPLDGDRADAYFMRGYQYQDLYSALGEDLGVAVLPMMEIDGEQKQMITPILCEFVGVNAACQEQDLAMELASFLASQDSQILRYELEGVIPASKNLEFHPTIVADGWPAVVIRNTTKCAFPFPVIADIGGYFTEIHFITSQILNGEKTVEDFM